MSRLDPMGEYAGQELSAVHKEKSLRSSITGGWSLKQVVVVFFAGLAIGILAKVNDTVAISWMPDINTEMGIWALALVLVARISANASSAAVLAGLFFFASTVGYYAWTAFILGYPTGDYAVMWGIVSISIVPPAAALIRRGFEAKLWIRALLGSLVASVPLASESVQRVGLYWQGIVPAELLRPAEAACQIFTALLIAVLFSRRWRTRFATLALALPLTIVARLLVEDLQQLVTRFG